MSINTSCLHCGARGKFQPSERTTTNPVNGDLCYNLTCASCSRSFLYPLNTPRLGKAPPKAAPPKPTPPVTNKAVEPLPNPTGWPRAVPPPRAPEPVPMPERGRPASHGPPKASTLEGWGKPLAPAPAPLPPPPPAPAAHVPPPVPAPPPPPAPGKKATGEKKKGDIPAWMLVPILIVVMAAVMFLVPTPAEKEPAPPKAGEKAPEKAPEKTPEPQPKPPEKAPDVGIDPATGPDTNLPPHTTPK